MMTRRRPHLPPRFGKAVSREIYNTGEGLRSLRDLTQHLTTRADDSHAAPLLHPRRRLPFLEACSNSSSLGEVLRLASN